VTKIFCEKGIQKLGSRQNGCQLLFGILFFRKKNFDAALFPPLFDKS